MTTDSSEVSLWLERMGFNGKQLGAAAEQMGISSVQLARKRDGKLGQELNLTERLAMAALRAGLPPWTPEADAELADVRVMRQLIDRIAQRQASADTSDA